MVKNLTGGNKHKKFARKNCATKTEGKLRTAQDDLELYAIVSKLLGNNMFQCMCIDGIERLGYIRGKFAGRNKRDNTIYVDTWVLVGLREWSDSSGAKDTKKKMEQCDLVEVYTDLEKKRLKENVMANWSILERASTTAQTDEEGKTTDDSVYFMSARDEERERLKEEILNSKTEKIRLETATESKVEEIDIWDI